MDAQKVETESAQPKTDRWYQYIDCEAGMVSSPTIGKIGEALSKAQGEIENAVKDSQNPFFRSSYADLASVWDACRKSLAKNGLSVIQGGGNLGKGDSAITITTLLLHSSGEWIKGSFSATPTKADPQGVGSCITYLRRYGLQAMVGIAPADDDGNDASGKGDKPQQNRTPATPTKKTEPVNKLSPEQEAKLKEAREWAIKPTQTTEPTEPPELFSSAAMSACEKVFMRDLETYYKAQKFDGGFVYDRDAMKAAVYNLLSRWPNDGKDLENVKAKITVEDVAKWGG